MLQVAHYSKMLYQAYNQRCLGGEYNNADLVAQIINLRLELANLLGYATYADYVLDMRMAKTPNAVFDFLNQLIAIFKPISETELAEPTISTFSSSNLLMLCNIIS